MKSFFLYALIFSGTTMFAAAYKKLSPENKEFNFGSMLKITPINDTVSHHIAFKRESSVILACLVGGHNLKKYFEDDIAQKALDSAEPFSYLGSRDRRAFQEQMKKVLIQNIKEEALLSNVVKSEEMIFFEFNKCCSVVSIWSMNHDGPIIAHYDEIVTVEKERQKYALPNTFKDPCLQELKRRGAEISKEKLQTYIAKRGALFAYELIKPAVEDCFKATDVNEESDSCCVIV
jgi:hypothetical protein